MLKAGAGISEGRYSKEDVGELAEYVRELSLKRLSLHFKGSCDRKMLCDKFAEASLPLAKGSPKELIINYKNLPDNFHDVRELVVNIALSLKEKGMVLVILDRDGAANCEPFSDDREIKAFLGMFSALDEYKDLCYVIEGESSKSASLPGLKDSKMSYETIKSLVAPATEDKKKREAPEKSNPASAPIPFRVEKILRSMEDNCTIA